MKLTSYVLSLMLLFSPAVFAQAPAGGKVTIATAIQRGYDAIKMNLKAAAEKMPEADYGFKPNPDIRAYGQLFGHVANAQFGSCAAAKGEANPNQGTNNEQKTTKAEFMKALDGSFAYCDPVYASLTDETAMQFVTQGKNEVMRGAVLMNNVVHNNEMYGTTAVYMRLKSMVPPSTEQEIQRKKK